METNELVLLNDLRDGVEQLGDITLVVLLTFAFVAGLLLFMSRGRGVMIFLLVLCLPGVVMAVGEYDDPWDYPNGFYCDTNWPPAWQGHYSTQWNANAGNRYHYAKDGETNAYWFMQAVAGGWWAWNNSGSSIYATNASGSDVLHDSWVTYPGGAPLSVPTVEDPAAGSTNGSYWTSNAVTVVTNTLVTITNQIEVIIGESLPGISNVLHDIYVDLGYVDGSGNWGSQDEALYYIWDELYRIRSEGISILGDVSATITGVVEVTIPMGYWSNMVAVQWGRDFRETSISNLVYEEGNGYLYDDPATNEPNYSAMNDTNGVIYDKYTNITGRVGEIEVIHAWELFDLDLPSLGTQTAYTWSVQSSGSLLFETNTEMTLQFGTIGPVVTIGRDVQLWLVRVGFIILCVIIIRKAIA